MALKKDNETYVEELEKAFESTGDLENYDLSKVDYIKATVKVLIGCKKHGDWLVAPFHPLNGRRCPKCKLDKLSNAFRTPLEELQKRSLETHGDKYTFLNIEAEYKNNESLISIKCEVHGLFRKSMNHFLNRSQGCPDCYTESEKEVWNKRSKETYFENCQVLNRGNISLDKFQYVDCKTKGVATCSLHGDFEVTPDALKHSKSGCPSCSHTVSLEEIEVREYIHSLGFITENNVEKLAGRKHIDIFIPEVNVGVEYCGIFSHSEFRKTDYSYHLKKYIEAKERGIHLIQIFSDEWIHEKEKVKSCLRIKLGKSAEYLSARKLVVSKSSLSEANEVYRRNHLQGIIFNGNLNYVLREKDGQAKAAMSFFITGTSCELIRFSSEGRVIGGFSKLLKEALSEIRGGGVSSVFSFSDNRWSEGEVYEKNGFKYSGISDPRYWWVKGTMRYHRRGFQRKYLPEKLKVFDPELSEAENCRANGFYKIHDAGVTKWILEI